MWETRPLFNKLTSDFDDVCTRIFDVDGTLANAQHVLGKLEFHYWLDIYIEQFPTFDWREIKHDQIQ